MSTILQIRVALLARASCINLIAACVDFVSDFGLSNLFRSYKAFKYISLFKGGGGSAWESGTLECSS